MITVGSHDYSTYNRGLIVNEGVYRNALFSVRRFSTDLGVRTYCHGDSPNEHVVSCHVPIHDHFQLP